MPPTVSGSRRGRGPAGRPALVVVCDDNYPPYVFRDATGTVRGILPDQWALWERKTGVTVGLRAMDWAAAPRVMEKGRADVIDTIFFTEERARRLDFTPAYATIKVPVYVHKARGGIGDRTEAQFTHGICPDCARRLYPELRARLLSEHQ
ncbi:MAG: transporter substrate-binding domain-containing protein [Lentisphaeria bacterium]